MSLKFTSENFDSDVLQSDLLVLVDFYADWCGPCKMMAPVIDKLAEEYDGIVKIGKINVDNYPDISANYSVMSIPTMLFFKNGEVVETIIGAVPVSILQEKINTFK